MHSLPDERLNELEGLRLAERLQRHLGHRQIASQVGQLRGKRRRGLQPFRADGAQQQHPAAMPAPVVAQVAQQVEGGPVHPVQVLQQQHQRGTLGQGVQEALDKLLLGGKREALVDERERRIVAYHESGHALVAAVLPDVDPLYKVTIVPRGRSLGATQFRPEDDRRNVPRTYLIERLAVALGGRSAEELALGEMTTGAENDLKEASQLARRMVSEWGMGEQTGPVVFDLSDGSPYLSQQPLEDRQRVYSEVTAERLDAEVERLITEAHQQARSVLTEHRDALDRLAQALLQEEVLEREQVLAIVNGGQNTQDGASGEKASQNTLIPES